MTMKTLLASAVMGVLVLSSACTTDDDIVFVAVNAALTSQSQCQAGKYYLPKGSLDLVADYQAGAGVEPNPMTYESNFIVKTTTLEKLITNDHPSLPNYGNVDTNQFIFEEAEISYDFSYAPLSPSQATLDAIPQRILRVANAYVNETSIPGQGGLILGATVVSVELMGRVIGEQLGVDLDISSLMSAPYTYPLVVNTRLRGQTAAGVRFQTRDFSYPIDLCVDCFANNTIPANDCYPPWQDNATN